MPWSNHPHTRHTSFSLFWQSDTRSYSTYVHVPLVHYVKFPRFISVEATKRVTHLGKKTVEKKFVSRLFNIRQHFTLIPLQNPCGSLLDINNEWMKLMVVLSLEFLCALYWWSLIGGSFDFSNVWLNNWLC